MGYLNYEFFDEFKALDNLCRDIYGESIDNKLGVTLYLEDMDRKAYQGAFKVSGWTSDYNYLKSVRNTRNELAHSLRTRCAGYSQQKQISLRAHGSKARLVSCVRYLPRFHIACVGKSRCQRNRIFKYYRECAPARCIALAPCEREYQGLCKSKV